MCAARRRTAAATAALALILPAAASADVLVVGDSLGVGTTPHLRTQLDEPLEGDSRIGRPSPEGVRVLASSLRRSHDVVVFDLGTNDDPSRPQVLANDLTAARRLAGDRCMVVATINRPPLNGVSPDGLNAAVEQFAASSERVEVVDWAGIVASDPSLLADDRVHATPAGYGVRGELFADAVRSCSEPKPVVDSEDGDFAPPRERRSRREKAEHVPGIESSGVVFTEPVAWRGGRGDLIVPGGEGPHAAVVMLPGDECQTHRREAEAFAAAGLAALVADDCRRGRSFNERAADARAAVAALAARRDIRSIALWGEGGAAVVAPLAAAGNTSVDAVVVSSPVVLPPVRGDEWQVRTALAESDAGSGTAAVSSAWRLSADAGDADRAFDPAPHWRGVTQPVLALWEAGDDELPSRAGAEALLAALRAGRNEDRTFRTVARPDAALAPSARWLEQRLARRPPGPVSDTPLPPPSEVQPVAIENATGIATFPVQAAWLLLPLLILAAGIIAARRGDPAEATGRLPAVVIALDVLALAAVAGAVASIIAADGRDVAAVAGMPAAIAAAFALTACAAVATLALALRRPRAPLPRAVIAASAAWVALALYWLL